MLMVVVLMSTLPICESNHSAPLDSQSILVKPTEVDLRLHVPMLSSHLVPSRRFGIILFDSESVAVEEPYVSARPHVPLFGRLAIPVHRFAVILFNSPPTLIEPADVILSFGIRLTG